MVKRQFPNPRDLADLMQFKKPTLSATERRLEKALTISDLRAIAKRRTPRAPFDYTEGAAEGELSLARARQAFQDVEFHPSILRNVPVVDTTREVLGGTSALPFGIAPTGFTRLMQTEGEVAGAGAAGAAGIPFTLSTLGTTSIEDVKAANPNGSQLVPALRHARPRDLLRAHAPRGIRRLRHPLLHGRHAGRRRPPARQAQRLLDPAAAHPRHRDRRDPAPGVVDRLPHDAEARVRVALIDWRHGRRAPRFRDGPDDLVRGPRHHPRDVAGQDRGQGRADGRGRETPRRSRRRRHRALEPRRPPARPRADPVPPAAPCRARGRQRPRGAPRHGHHVGRRHRRVDRARRAVHADRPRVPLRTHGGRPPRCRPDDRDSAHRDRAHDEAPRSRVARRARPAARHPVGAAHADRETGDGCRGGAASAKPKTVRSPRAGSGSKSAGRRRRAAKPASAKPASRSSVTK